MLRLSQYSEGRPTAHCSLIPETAFHAVQRPGLHPVPFGTASGVQILHHTDTAQNSLNTRNPAPYIHSNNPQTHSSGRYLPWKPSGIQTAFPCHTSRVCQKALLHPMYAHNASRSEFWLLQVHASLHQSDPETSDPERHLRQLYSNTHC